jgi:hypothetical protein
MVVAALKCWLSAERLMPALFATSDIRNALSKLRLMKSIALFTCDSLLWGRAICSRRAA